MFRLTAYEYGSFASKHFTSFLYRLDMRPDWLLTVLDVAKVAGKLPVIRNQPPKHILWFETDDNHNLVRFTHDL